jgi:hypothetical protein
MSNVWCLGTRSFKVPSLGGRVGGDDIRISCLISLIITIMGQVFLLSVYTLSILSKYQTNLVDESFQRALILTAKPRLYTTILCNF